MLENLAVALIITVVFGYQSPKSSGMIAMYKMCEFVDEDVVNHCWLVVHEMPVKIEIALISAAAPTGRLVFEGNAPYGHFKLHFGVQLR